jgi:hypothetical protein
LFAEEDVVDSDFDDPEIESDDDEILVEKEKKTKRSGKYVDPADKRKTAAKAKAPAGTHIFCSYIVFPV